MTPGEEVKIIREMSLAIAAAGVHSEDLRNDLLSDAKKGKWDGEAQAAFNVVRQRLEAGEKLRTEGAKLNAHILGEYQWYSSDLMSALIEYDKATEAPHD